VALLESKVPRLEEKEKLVTTQAIIIDELTVELDEMRKTADM